MKSSWFAILEVLGVIGFGWTCTKVITTSLGFPDLQLELNSVSNNHALPLTPLSVNAFYILSIQFLCLMIPALLFNKFKRSMDFKDIGFIRNKQKHPNPLKTSLILFCSLGLFMKVFLWIHNIVDLGQEPISWMVFNRSWNLEFWIFMAIGSFILIPIYEEIFYRGYIYHVFVKYFGEIGIMFSTLLFTLVHMQYYIFDTFNILMLTSLLLMSLAMSLSIYFTKSILAPIIIHSLMNIPISYPFDGIIIIIMIVILTYFRKEFVSLALETIQIFKRIEFRKHFNVLLILILFPIGLIVIPNLFIILLNCLFIYVCFKTYSSAQNRQ